MVEFCQQRELATAKVGLLPCHIEYNGEADLEKYFTASNGNEHVSFRGRALVPKVEPIPEGFNGINFFTSRSHIR